jgi:hypothetical protein
VKPPCYAASGLSEGWIADLVETYPVPAATSDTETRRLVRGQHAAPAAFPDVVLPVADIVGRGADGRRATAPGTIRPAPPRGW